MGISLHGWETDVVLLQLLAVFSELLCHGFGFDRGLSWVCCFLLQLIWGFLCAVCFRFFVGFAGCLRCFVAGLFVFVSVGLPPLFFFGWLLLGLPFLGLFLAVLLPVFPCIRWLWPCFIYMMQFKKKIKLYCSKNIAFLNSTLISHFLQRTSSSLVI